MSIELESKFRQALVNNDTATLEMIKALPDSPIRKFINLANADKKRTALHLTVSLGNLATTAWLVNNGANELAQDSLGQTPVSLAGSMRIRHIVCFFNDHARKKLLPQIAMNTLGLRLFNAKTSPFQTTNPLVRVTLKVHEADQWKIGNKLVKKISIIMTMLTNPHNDKITWSSGVVLYKCFDGTLLAYENQTDIRQIQTLFSLCVLADGYAEYAHSLVNRREKLDWQNDTTKNVYKRDEETRQFYSKVNAYIAEKVYDAIATMPQMDVQLFSFGCGTGKDLIATSQKLKQKGYRCHGIGFDCNSANFPKKEENIQFLEGNMLHAGSLVARHLKQESIKVGLFVGSLVNQCLSGTAEALNVLQQLNMLDVIVLTGFTPVLVNKAMAKALGWEVTIENITSNIDGISSHRITTTEERSRHDIREVYTLTKMSPEKRKAFLIKRSITKPKAQELLMLLDLSMSADPVRDIKLFTPEELSSVRLLDLRWAAPMDAATLLHQFPSSIQVVVTGQESWLKDIAQDERIKIAIRKHSSVNEVPAFTSKELSALKRPL